jgi:hypothetical protein
LGHALRVDYPGLADSLCVDLLGSAERSGALRAYLKLARRFFDAELGTHVGFLIRNLQEVPMVSRHLVAVNPELGKPWWE